MNDHHWTDQRMEELEKKIEAQVTKGVTTGITVLITVAIVFVLAMIVFKFVWAWVIPDLFPGAVAQGLISANLSWLSSLKLAVLAAVLTGFGPSVEEAFKIRP